MAWISRSLIVIALSFVVVGAGCRKKADKPKSSKKKREDMIQQANAEQAALMDFVKAVHGVLAWHQSQPADIARQSMLQGLVEKMERVPVKGLPDNLAKAWSLMLDSWQSLARNPSPDASLREQGARAADELNRQLAARGVTGIRF